jgi:HD-like signal output (HDOD) protein
MSEVLRELVLRDRLDKKIQELPALPSAVMRVVQESEKLEPNTDKIESYISADQALTSKVLRVVNSAYYGLSGQVTSVSQAIVILGLQQVRNLALSVGALSVFPTRTPHHEAIMSRFWMHAFGTAAATQLIAERKRMGAQTAEVLLIGGLLHDMGRLLLYSNFTEEYEQILDYAINRGIVIERAERVVLGMNHAEIGQEMAVRWRLPSVITSMIGHHEGPFDGSEDTIVYGVHVADAITKHLYFPNEPRPEESLDPIADSWLNLSVRDLDELREQTLERVLEAWSGFAEAA